MPGKLVLLYGLELITTNPAIPRLARRHPLEPRRAADVLVRAEAVRRSAVALYAAILYLFVPAKLFFFPLMNTVTPVVVLATACVIVEWLRTARLRWAAAVGVMLYVIVFFEPLPLVLGLLFAALALRAVHLGNLTWRQLLVHTTAALAAFALLAAAVYQLTGFNLALAFQAVRGHALEFNAIERRPYDVWIRANPVEFFFGIGVCQAVLIVGALALGLRGGGRWLDRFAQPLPLVTPSSVWCWRPT